MDKTASRLKLFQQWLVTCQSYSKSEQEERATHRTLILRVERTDGLNGASSFPAGLFGGALLAESKVCLRLSSAALLFAGTGLNMEVRLGFAFCTIYTYRSSPSLQRLYSYGCWTGGDTYHLSSAMNLLQFSVVRKFLKNKMKYKLKNKYKTKHQVHLHI